MNNQFEPQQQPVQQNSALSALFDTMSNQGAA
jgi:hypothetical protein